MDIHDLIRSEYGVDTMDNINPLVTVVSTSVTAITRNNPNRIGLIVFNIHASQQLYILPNRSVSTTVGMRINPGGGSMASNWRDDFHLPSRAWYAIASGANTNILVIEILIASPAGLPGGET